VTKTASYIFYVARQFGEYKISSYNIIWTTREKLELQLQRREEGKQ